MDFASNDSSVSFSEQKQVNDSKVCLFRILLIILLAASWLRSLLGVPLDYLIPSFGGQGCVSMGPCLGEAPRHPRKKKIKSWQHILDDSFV